MLFRDRSSASTPPNARVDAVTIRDVEPSDRTFLLELTRAAFLSYGSYDQYVEDWLGHDAVQTCIATWSGHAAGFYMLTSYRDADRPGVAVADLIAIAVAEEYQSRGVGTRLLDHAVAAAVSAESSPEELWLVVSDGNARARRFFARQGFRQGEGVGVYPAGQRALRMVRPLREAP